MSSVMHPSRRPRVVIVGAGFGGLQTAQSLAGSNAEVLLIDRNNYHTFVPLLYQVASAQLEATSIAHPVRTLLRHKRNVRFLTANVQHVNFQTQAVETDGAVVPYDYLVLATGSQPRWHGVSGASTHAFPLKNLTNAIALRNHVLHCFERAVQLSNPAERQRLLRFVVVGGGATGVEMAGALAELIHWSLRRDFPELTQSLSPLGVSPQIVLLHGGDRLMPEFPERLGRYTVHHLTRLGVAVRLQSRIQSVSKTRARLQSGETIETATLVWAAGLEAEVPELQEPMATTPQGKLTVLETLQLKRYANVYAIGDLADVQHTSKPLAGVAPEALQQGVTVAKNIRRQLNGRSPLPFRYFNKGRLAIVGGFGGVGQIAGVAFTGFLAWLMWLGVHLVYLPGYRNRLLVLLSWVHGYLWRDRPIRQRVVLPEIRASRVPTNVGTKP